MGINGNKRDSRRYRRSRACRYYEPLWVMSKEQLRYVRLLYRVGMGNEEIIDDMIITAIRPAISREVKLYTKGLKREDCLAPIKTTKEEEKDV